MTLKSVLCILLALCALRADARSHRQVKNNQAAQAEAAQQKVIDIAAIARQQAMNSPAEIPAATQKNQYAGGYRTVLLPLLITVLCGLTTFTALRFARGVKFTEFFTRIRRNTPAKIRLEVAEPVITLPMPSPAARELTIQLQPETAPAAFAAEETMADYSHRDPAGISAAAAEGPVDLTKVAKMLGVGIGELKLAVHLREVVAARQIGELAV